MMLRISARSPSRPMKMRLPKTIAAISIEPAEFRGLRRYAMTQDRNPEFPDRQPIW